jgi:hypothetical protein
MNLPRHDDLENPPDFCELRDDYWQLWDQLKAAEIKMAKIAEYISPMEHGHPDNLFLSNDLALAQPEDHNKPSNT